MERTIQFDMILNRAYKTDKKRTVSISAEQLSKEEKYILALLTHADGSALTFTEIKRNMDCSNIRTRDAINKLYRKYLIKPYGNSFSSEAYILSNNGLEFVVGIDWDEKLKNL